MKRLCVYGIVGTILAVTLVTFFSGCGKLGVRELSAKDCRKIIECLVSRSGWKDADKIKIISVKKVDSYFQETITGDMTLLTIEFVAQVEYLEDVDDCPPVLVLSPLTPFYIKPGYKGEKKELEGKLSFRKIPNTETEYEGPDGKFYFLNSEFTTQSRRGGSSR